MNTKYMVVLFKNKVKRKIIKKFSNLKKAESFFSETLKNSSSIVFDKRFENGLECSFSLGLIDCNNKGDGLVFIQDDFGRNIKVKFDDDTFSLLKISNFRLEEEIFDIAKKTKITFDEIINYLRGLDTLKVVYTLNNKLIIQKDEDFKVFSLKNEFETERLLNLLAETFISEKRKDCMFVHDTSTAQRKYLLKLLSDYGFEKKLLYRKYTTFPKSN